MKRLSRTFLNVGIVISWIAVGVLAFTGLVCIIAGVLPPIHDAIRTGIENGNVQSDFPDADTAIAFYIAVMVTSGVVCLMFIPLPIINAVLSKKALTNPTRGLYISCMIFGSINSKFTLAGGILGMIALARENRRKANIIE